jgi:hypothetical protein
MKKRIEGKDETTEKRERGEMGIGRQLLEMFVPPLPTVSSSRDEKKERRSQSIDGQETGSAHRPQHNRYQGLVTQKTKPKI